MKCCLPSPRASPSFRSTPPPSPPASNGCPQTQLKRVCWPPRSGATPPPSPLPSNLVARWFLSPRSSDALPHALTALEESGESPSPHLLAALIANVDPSYGSSEGEREAIVSAAQSLATLDRSVASCCSALNVTSRAIATAAFSLITASATTFTLADLERCLPELTDRVLTIFRSIVGPEWLDEDLQLVA